MLFRSLASNDGLGVADPSPNAIRNKLRLPSSSSDDDDSQNFFGFTNIFNLPTVDAKNSGGSLNLGAVIQL